jgi:hypothetical protein
MGKQLLTSDDAVRQVDAILHVEKVLFCVNRPLCVYEGQIGLHPVTVLLHRPEMMHADTGKTLAKMFACMGVRGSMGCQRVYFQTKNADWGKFWRALEWKRLVCSMAIWNILWSFGNSVAIWYIFHRFGMMCTGKSGNPGSVSAQGRAGRPPRPERARAGQRMYDMQMYSTGSEPLRPPP